MKRIVLCIVGPTASGKTSLALLIADSLHGEIISADSRQVYRHLDIGTAKPTAEDRRKTKHHFIDMFEPDEEFNAGEFGKEGREVIDRVFSRSKIPIVVGGSGLYVQSLIDGFFEGPPRSSDVREKLVQRLQKGGVENLLGELRKVDPLSAAKMLPSNTRRIIRAMEVYQLTGMPLSELQERKIHVDFSPKLFGLEWDRAVLYARINERVDSMLKDGLLEEVRKLKSLGYSETTNALQTVGYQEVFSFLREEISYEKMVDLIKRNTRRFAKRQLTWFRRDKRIHWLPITDEDQLASIAKKIVRVYRASCA